MSWTGWAVVTQVRRYHVDTWEPLSRTACSADTEQGRKKSPTPPLSWGVVGPPARLGGRFRLLWAGSLEKAAGESRLACRLRAEGVKKGVWIGAPPKRQRGTCGLSM